MLTARHARLHLFSHRKSYRVNSRRRERTTAANSEGARTDASAPPVSGVSQPDHVEHAESPEGTMTNENSTRGVSDDTKTTPVDRQRHKSNPSARSPRRTMKSDRANRTSTSPKPASRIYGERAGIDRSVGKHMVGQTRMCPSRARCCVYPPDARRISHAITPRKSNAVVLPRSSKQKES